jgi:hypothetical protein
MPRRPQQQPTEPLVRWEEAPPQVNVLDWRKRATEYGLRAPAAGEDDDEPAEFERIPKLSKRRHSSTEPARSRALTS